MFVDNKNGRSGFVRNRKFLWWSKPDTSAPFNLTYNKYGFRDKDWKVAKNESEQRIMFIGDSFTEGIMVTGDQTIPAYFSSFFSDSPIDAMNLGMLGTGLEQYLQLIADAVPIFQPDAVVLIIYSNDFTTNEIQIPEFSLEADYFNHLKPRLIEIVQQHKQGNPVPSVFQFSSSNTLPDTAATWFPFKGRINQMYEHADSALVEPMLQGQFNPYKLNEILKMEVALRTQNDFRNPLGFFSYYADQFGFKPIVVFIPCRHQITDHYLKYEKMVCKTLDPRVSLTDSSYQVNTFILESTCKELGIQFIDTSDTLAYLESKGKRLYWDYDDHMRNGGYRTVAKLIAERW